MTTGFYSFLAIAGNQGDFPYYLVHCPLRLVPRLFLFDEAEVPAQLRKSRSFNTVVASDIAKNIIARPNEYTLTPLVVSVSDQVAFTPLLPEHPEVGQLTVPLTAQLIIHDGQHRRMAIQKFLEEIPDRGGDTIPIMLLPDPQLTRASKIYTDLNYVSAQGSRSQRVLRDSGDLAVFVRQMIDEVPIFQDRIELEKTTISNRSSALFTLSAVYQATEALLHLGKNDVVSAEHTTIAQKFWLELGEIIPEWKQVIQHEMTASYLRANYIHAHTVTLLAIGIAGNALIQAYPTDWSERLQSLGSLDWSRTNTQLWEGRAMVRGRMSKAQDSVNLTVITIKQNLGLEISDKERVLEDRMSI